MSLGLGAGPAAWAQSGTESVAPGINAEYKKPDLNVNQWVERFEREGREVYDQRARIVETARIRPGMVVADIGTGTGMFLPALSAATGAEGKVYAVDIVPDFLEHITARMKGEGITNVRTVVCTERSVELPAASIDLAFICDVYHHFEYPADSLRSLHRALKAGGEVMLVEFKRVPGESSDWILRHVRAGEETVRAEIEAAGFKQIERPDFLKDNYILRFRKVEPTAP
ncbi:MAG: class I SAM-dependent methyltransferase [Verrucomicrobiales bacterium]|nr:class I SAM-dependent methyltransferase [Verrucomicrobiales bacterium]